MKLKTRAWLVSQGLLVVTAIIIQLTFYREIKVGPMLGMPKRDYWDIIKNVEPSVPQYAIENHSCMMHDFPKPSTKFKKQTLVLIDKPIVKKRDFARH